MLIGYARVSTGDQNLDLQLDALNAAGCYQVCTDQVSGAAKHSPGLEEEVAKNLGVGRATLYRSIKPASSLADMLTKMPNVGIDSDFDRAANTVS